MTKIEGNDGFKRYAPLLAYVQKAFQLKSLIGRAQDDIGFTKADVNRREFKGRI